MKVKALKNALFVSRAEMVLTRSWYSQLVELPNYDGYGKELLCVVFYALSGAHHALYAPFVREAAPFLKGPFLK